MVEVVFTMMCPPCGEAYDATIGGEHFGHMRLRWGHFRTHNADNASRHPALLGIFCRTSTG